MTQQHMTEFFFRQYLITDHSIVGFFRYMPSGLESGNDLEHFTKIDYVLLKPTINFLFYTTKTMFFTVHILIVQVLTQTHEVTDISFFDKLWVFDIHQKSYT